MRARLHDADHVELWWAAEHALLERVADGIRWRARGEPPSPSTAAPGPRADAALEVASWLAERVRRAARGEAERVVVPLVQISEGWGCPCPSFYVGHDPTEHSGEETWVEVELAPGVTIPEAPIERLGGGAASSRGQVLEVEAQLTGEVRTREEPHGYTYRVAVLRVTRVRRTLRGPARASATLSIAR